LIHQTTDKLVSYHYLELLTAAKLGEVAPNEAGMTGNNDMADL
jgi:hypothetical protein